MTFFFLAECNKEEKKSRYGGCSIPQDAGTGGAEPPLGLVEPPPPQHRTNDHLRLWPWGGGAQKSTALHAACMTTSVSYASGWLAPSAIRAATAKGRTHIKKKKIPSGHAQEPVRLLWPLWAPVPENG